MTSCAAAKRWGLGSSASCRPLGFRFLKSEYRRDGGFLSLSSDGFGLPMSSTSLSSGLNVGALK